MIRKSTAVWRGDGMHGKGALTTQSGALHDHAYGFNTRFQSEDGKAGTNPEELLGAAHAGCFAMATAFALSGAGHAPDEMTVVAAVNLQKDGDGFKIADIVLTLEAKVSGLDDAKFQAIAKGAKENCPLSKALSATPITLSAKLL